MIFGKMIIDNRDDDEHEQLIEVKALLKEIALRLEKE